MLPEYFRANCKLLEPPSKNLYRNELLQKARRLTKGVEIVFWLDNLCRGDDLNEPYFKQSEVYATKELYPLFIEYSGYKDDQKLKVNFPKIIQTYFDKEGICYDKDRNTGGTTFQILSGLPEKIKVDGTMVADFFNNGSGYKTDDIKDEAQMKLLTDDFNDKFNTNVTAIALKKAVEELMKEMPF